MRMSYRCSPEEHRKSRLLARRDVGDDTSFNKTGLDECAWLGQLTTKETKRRLKYFIPELTFKKRNIKCILSTFEKYDG